MFLWRALNLSRLQTSNHTDTWSCKSCYVQKNTHNSPIWEWRISKIMVKSTMMNRKSHIIVISLHSLRSSSHTCSFICFSRTREMSSHPWNILILGDSDAFSKSLDGSLSSSWSLNSPSCTSSLLRKRRSWNWQYTITPLSHITQGAEGIGVCPMFIKSLESKSCHVRGDSSRPYRVVFSLHTLFDSVSPNCFGNDIWTSHSSASWRNALLQFTRWTSHWYSAAMATINHTSVMATTGANVEQVLHYPSFTISPVLPYTSWSTVPIPFEFNNPLAKSHWSISWSVNQF